MATPRARPPLRIKLRPDPDYWQRLGHFIETFAEAEEMLFAFFMRSAPVPDATARVVLERTTATDLIKYLRRIWEVNTAAHPEKKEMDVVLGQLDTIAGMRNKLVHHASRVAAGGNRVTSDAIRKADPMQAYSYVVSPTDLEAMVADLERISMHFAAWMANPNLASSVRASYFPALFDAWRYKGPKRSRP